MDSRIKSEILKLLNEALKELDSSKGSVIVAVQKISRVAYLLDDIDLIIWCEIQFGNTKFTIPIKNYIEAYSELSKQKTKDNKDKIDKRTEEVEKLGLKKDVHLVIDELAVKCSKSGGGFANIGFIEERYADLVRTKKGNDGTYYKSNLLNHITYIKQSAHNKAADLYKKLTFSDMPQNTFDILKMEIDDKLMDLNSELAEKIMLAFQAVSTDNPEQWSQALTSCRRFLEGLADELFPPREERINGRLVGQPQFINRIWAFMDDKIGSSSNKEMAKNHVDFLGQYLQSIYKLTNKGVHSSLTKIEATKAVFHTYLMAADILEFIQKDISFKNKKPNINAISIDELEAVLNINRSIAKEIVKLRVLNGKVNIEMIKSIKGVGPSTIDKVEKLLSFED